jgi:hypothetical protein
LAVGWDPPRALSLSLSLSWRSRARGSKQTRLRPRPPIRPKNKKKSLSPSCLARQRARARARSPQRGGKKILSLFYPPDAPHRERFPSISRARMRALARPQSRKYTTPAKQRLAGPARGRLQRREISSTNFPLSPLFSLSLSPIHGWTHCRATASDPDARARASVVCWPLRHQQTTRQDRALGTRFRQRLYKESDRFRPALAHHPRARPHPSSASPGLPDLPTYLPTSLALPTRPRGESSRRKRSFSPPQPPDLNLPTRSRGEY